MPEGWEKDAGSIGEAKLINWPELTQTDMARYRKELREREAKKIRLGFPLPPGVSDDDLK